MLGRRHLRLGCRDGWPFRYVNGCMATHYDSMGAGVVQCSFQAFESILETRFPMTPVAVLEDRLVAADAAECRLDHIPPAHSWAENIRLGTQETMRQKTRLPVVVSVLQGALRAQGIATCV